MTKHAKRSQKGGLSITKRGAVLEDIKKDRLDKFAEHLQKLDTTSFDNNKAMWLAIELSRPNHFNILGQFNGVNITAATKNKQGRDETVLQYALRVADFPTIQAVINFPNAQGFKIDQNSVYDLLLAINHVDSKKVLELLFNYKDPATGFKKYKFYDPENNALEKAMLKNAEIAQLVLHNTHRDPISLNLQSYKLIQIIKTKNDDNYVKLFRELVLGKLSRNPSDKEVYRPKLDMNFITQSYQNSNTRIFEFLDNPGLLEIALFDGNADPNVRLGGIGDTPLHIAVKLYKDNKGAAKPILSLLKRAGARMLINIKTGLLPIQLLTQSEQESFLQDDRNNFK